MMSEFFKMVYETVANIPPGRVTSYGAIARFLASPQSARMVGWALNKSFTQPLEIPAHRVVNRNGLLSGKNAFGDEFEMQRRLEKEGIKVENDQIVNFEKIFWDPANPD